MINDVRPISTIKVQKPWHYVFISMCCLSRLLALGRLAAAMNGNTEGETRLGYLPYLPIVTNPSCQSCAHFLAPLPAMQDAAKMQRGIVSKPS